jgi:hypothetical protein
MSQIGSRRMTEYFKYYIKHKKSLSLYEEKYQHMIESEIDYSFLDDENNCKIIKILYLIYI